MTLWIEHIQEIGTYTQDVGRHPYRAILHPSRAEAPAEAVIHEEPEHPATGADAVLEPGCGAAGEFLPFQPEKIVEQSAQLHDALVVSVEFSAARVQGAKSDLSGGEGGCKRGRKPCRRLPLGRARIHNLANV